VIGGENILQLDYYIIPPVRIYIMIFGVFMVLAFPFNNEAYMNFGLYAMRLLTFCAGVFTLVLSVTRRSLFVEHRNMYTALTFYDKVLIKRYIDVSVFETGSVERLDKSDVWSVSFLPNFLREYNGFAIYLHGKEQKEKLRIMNLSDAERVNSTIEFIHEHSNIKFAKTQYSNHW